MSAIQYLITKYAQKGYRLISESQTQAQMIRPRQFSCSLFLVLFVLGIVPGLVYWVFQQEKSALIVDTGMGVSITNERGQAKFYGYDEIDKSEGLINWRVLLIIVLIVFALAIIGAVINS